MQRIARNHSGPVVEEVAAGRANPFTDYTSRALAAMLVDGTTSPEAVDAACDAFVRERAADTLTELAEGAVPYAHPTVRRVLERAVVLDLISADALARACGGVNDDNAEHHRPTVPYAPLGSLLADGMC